MSDLSKFLLARIAEDEEFALRYPPTAAARPRALAECEAKRQVVDAYRGLWEVAKATARAGRDEEANVARNMYAGVELAMQALALPYADHPDYREEWRG